MVVISVSNLSAKMMISEVAHGSAVAYYGYTRYRSFFDLARRGMSREDDRRHYCILRSACSGLERWWTLLVWPSKTFTKEIGRAYGCSGRSG